MLSLPTFDHLGCDEEMRLSHRHLGMNLHLSNEVHDEVRTREIIADVLIHQLDGPAPVSLLESPDQIQRYKWSLK